MTPFKLSAAAAAVACAIWLATSGSEGSDRSEIRTAAATPIAGEASLASARSTEKAQAPLERDQREVAAVSPLEEEPITEPVATAVEQLEGWVRDLDGEGIAGLEVHFVPSRTFAPGASRDAEPGVPVEPVVTGQDGRFETPLPEGRGVFQVKDANWKEIWSPVLQGTAPPEELVLRVAPARTYGGVVVGLDGLPVAGIPVKLRWPEKLPLTDIAARPFFARLAEQTETDEFGRFRFPAIGWVEGLTVSAESNAHRWTEEELPNFDDTDLSLVVEATEVTGIVLSGTVTDADGVPFGTADVTAGGLCARCDAAGNFHLEVDSEDLARGLVAVAKGYLPARLDLASLTPFELAHLEIRLAEQTASIRGRVVDENGDPLEGLTVQALGEHTFGMVPMDLAGTEFFVESSIEALIGGGSQKAITDRNGSFEITGLLTEEYGVFALDRKSLRRSAQVFVEAGGSPIRLEIRGCEERVTLSGRVVDSSGAPRAGAEVQLRGSGPDDTTLLGPEMVVGKDGGFRFEGVCLDDRIAIQAKASDAPDLVSIEVFPGSETDSLEILLPVQATLEVSLNDPGQADAIRVLDAAEQELLLEVSLRDADVAGYRAELVDGHSGRLRVEATGVTLVLLDWDESTREWNEVNRLPLDLEPGELTVVRP